MRGNGDIRGSGRSPYHGARILEAGIMRIGWDVHHGFRWESRQRCAPLRVRAAVGSGNMTVRECMSDQSVLMFAALGKPRPGARTRRFMGSRWSIWVGIFIGSTIGGVIPELWGASAFSYSSVLFSSIGAFAGLWIGSETASASLVLIAPNLASGMGLGM
jgi:hypothetical protein